MAYGAANYFRVLQRAIRPLYFKEELGGIGYLATATFLYYKNKHFVVLAYHSLETVKKLRNIQDIKNIWNILGFLTLDGEFRLLEDNLVGHKIYEDFDIVICELSNNSVPVQEISFLNLNLNNDNGRFRNEFFDWIGFPANKASGYHKTKVKGLY